MTTTTTSKNSKFHHHRSASLEAWQDENGVASINATVSAGNGEDWHRSSGPLVVVNISAGNVDTGVSLKPEAARKLRDMLTAALRVYDRHRI